MPSALPFRLPRVIAHRGASGSAPENTLAAICLAAEQGARWVEVDVMVTRDGHPVIHHDETLERCTDGSGPLLACDLESLSKLDAGAWFDTRFAGERVPTLEALIALLKELGMGLNLELKPLPGWEGPTTRAVAKVLASHWPTRQPLLVSSFSERALANFAARLPGAPRGYLTNVVPPDWRERLADTGCRTLHCQAGPLLQREAVSALKSAGIGVLCYTVNELEDAERLLNWGAAGVFSDHPARLLQRLGP
jgi:glycerophosphoryl diester phosphodiesterase